MIGRGWPDSPALPHLRIRVIAAGRALERTGDLVWVVEGIPA